MYHYELKHLLSSNLLKFSPFLKLILAFSSWLLILFYITLVVFDNSLTIWYVKLFQALNMYFLPQTWISHLFSWNYCRALAIGLCDSHPSFGCISNKYLLGIGEVCLFSGLSDDLDFHYFLLSTYMEVQKKRSCKKRVLSQSVYFLGSWG